MRKILIGMATIWASLASEVALAQTAIPPPLTEGCTFRLTSEVAGDPGLYIPDSPGDVVGGPTRPSGALRLVKHRNAGDDGSLAVKSGDTLYIRTTTGDDQWIWIDPTNTSSPRIAVRAEEGKKQGGFSGVKKKSILRIRKLLITNPPTFAPDGTEIHLGDIVILRDTVGADRRLRLEGSSTPVWGVKTDDEATAFRILDLDSPPCPPPAGAPVAGESDDWVSIGWMHGPECSTLEWTNTGIFGTPSPTWRHGPQDFEAFASYDRNAFNAAKNDILNCLKTAAAAAGLASIISSPAGAQPSFSAALWACLDRNGVESKLRKIPQLKVESRCDYD